MYTRYSYSYTKYSYWYSYSSCTCILRYVTYLVSCQKPAMYRPTQFTCFHTFYFLASSTNNTNVAQSSSTTECSLSAQQISGINCEYEASFDCFGFWQEHRGRTLDELYFPAIRALSVGYPYQVRQLSVCSAKAG